MMPLGRAILLMPSVFVLKYTITNLNGKHPLHQTKVRPSAFETINGLEGIAHPCF